MVIQVDNTTSSIISELHNSIKDTISVLEDGQNELQGLVENVKTICSNSLSTDQAEIFLHQLSTQKDKLVSDFSTQFECLSVSVKNVVKASLENKSALTTVESLIKELGESIGSNISIQDDSRRELLELVSNVEVICKNAATSDQVNVVLEQLAAQKDDIISSLSERLDALFTTATKAVSLALDNKKTLEAIAAYLSLPGYKRILKGMEAVHHEAIE